jgi:hypothetical protein
LFFQIIYLFSPIEKETKEAYQVLTAGKIDVGDKLSFYPNIKT